MNGRFSIVPFSAPSELLFGAMRSRVPLRSGSAYCAQSSNFMSVNALFPWYMFSPFLTRIGLTGHAYTCRRRCCLFPDCPGVGAELLPSLRPSV
jgi:hypothetical protein